MFGCKIKVRQKYIVMQNHDDFEIKSKINSHNCLSCFIDILNCNGKKYNERQGKFTSLS